MHYHNNQEYPKWGFVDIIAVVIVSYVLWHISNRPFAAFVLRYITPHASKSEFVSLYATLAKISFLLIFFLFIYIDIAKHHRLSFIRALKFEKPEKFSLVYTLPLAALIWFISSNITAHLTTEPKLIETLTTIPSVLIYVVLSVSIVPIVEEIFWRGFTYPVFEKKFGKVTAIIAISLLFTIYHAESFWGSWLMVIPFFIGGIILTLLRAFTKSILPCILTHWVYNLILTIDGVRVFLK